MSVSEWTDEQAIAHGRAWVDAGWQFKRWQVLVFDGQIRADYGSGAVCLRADADGFVLALLPSDSKIGLHSSQALPDPRDPGFIGHAVAQVRDRLEIYGLGLTEAMRDGGIVWLAVQADDMFGCGDTDVEALLDAFTRGAK